MIFNNPVFSFFQVMDGAWRKDCESTRVMTERQRIVDKWMLERAIVCMKALMFVKGMLMIAEKWYWLSLCVMKMLLNLIEPQMILQSRS